MSDQTPPGPSTGQPDPDQHHDRADRLQERFAVPVLVAALASVPAVFLTLFDGTLETVGATVNTLSGAVLVAEAVVLFAVSERRWRWVRENLLLVGLTLLILPAVIFAVGPVQLLRLLRVFGALRIVRVGRIVKAGRILRERAGLDRIWQKVAGFGISLLVAGFVAIVLADPSSQSRQLLDGALDQVGLVGVLLAGAVLAGATWVVASARSGRSEDSP